ncbi:MAG: ion transporter [Candidatus Spechtbacterales bacterium]
MKNINKIKYFVIELREKLWYIIIIAALALISGGMLAYEFFGDNVTEETLRRMNALDLIIAYIFLADFSAGVYFAPKKWRHIKQNLLDFFGSIPFSNGFFQALRILRFARLTRLLRAGNIVQNIEGGIVELYKKRASKNGVGGNRDKV